MPRIAGGGIHDFQCAEGKLYFSVGWKHIDRSMDDPCRPFAVASLNFGIDDDFEFVDRELKEPTHSLAQVDIGGRTALLWRTRPRILAAFVPETGKRYRFKLATDVKGSSLDACHSDDGGRVVVHDRQVDCQIYRLSDLRYDEVQQIGPSRGGTIFPDDGPKSGPSSSVESSEPRFEEYPPRERSSEVQRKASGSRSPLIVAAALSAFALLALGAYVGGRQLIR